MVKSILLILSIVFISCEVVNIDYLKPIMGTNEPSSILANSVVLGGTVIGEGGKNVTEYGIVYSENFPPTILDTKMIEGSRLGQFSKRYEGLNSNTSYYCSAYGINDTGVGYGEVYKFKTDAEPPCSPTIDNRIDKGNEMLIEQFINIGDVDLKTESLGFNDGNLEFETRTSSSTFYITLNFNEIGRELPQTGEYTSVNQFDNQSTMSNGEVKAGITDWGINGIGGAGCSPGNKIYVENDGNDNITFIFCDVPFSDKYNLTGKFTY